MTIKKIYKKDEDKFKYLFTLNVSKHDYDYIHEFANRNKTSIRKVIRNIINSHYNNVQDNKKQEQ
jgi:hypothetical protein